MPGSAAAIPKKRKAKKIRRVKKVKSIRKTVRKGQVDFIMFFMIVLLVLFGTVMVFSASYYEALTNPKINDMYSFLKSQIKWVLLGFAGMVFLMNFNYRVLKGFAFLAYVFSNFCLALVPIIGKEINGSKRWLGVGSLSFQPSEVAKIAVVLYLAFYITSHRNILNKFSGFVRCYVIIGIPFLLIAVQNLSTAIVVAGMGTVMIFVASPKIWYFFPLAGVGTAGIAALVLIPAFRYRLSRIQIWLDPFSDPTGKGFQIIQSLFAVASGGFFGLGLGQSRQKTYIPMAYNDIIFAIICEEMGLIGAIIIILLFTILIWRGVKVAMNAIDMFGCLLSVGIISMIAIQVIINIAVVTNTIPNTGMPLPFISYGGTSLVFTMASMGILLNISRYQKILD